MQAIDQVLGRMPATCLPFSTLFGFLDLLFVEQHVSLSLLKNKTQGRGLSPPTIMS
jgi:hypothetical protein